MIDGEPLSVRQLAAPHLARTGPTTGAGAGPDAHIERIDRAAALTADHHPEVDDLVTGREHAPFGRS